MSDFDFDFDEIDDIVNAIGGGLKDELDEFDAINDMLRDGDEIPSSVEASNSVNAQPIESSTTEPNNAAEENEQATTHLYSGLYRKTTFEFKTNNRFILI